VQYAPSRGRFKVYLIDEVHMLSSHSFNALLKTLEEPPPYVKFILATTDPQKLPATILSRCLQFSLKNMTPERVVEHLSHVLGVENVPFEDDALWLLGRAADGSMRDAMSLTDQAIAFGEGKVLAADVRAMLGTLDHGQVYGVLQALLDGDARALLEAVRHLAEQGPDWNGVLAEMLNVLHRVAIAQALPEAVDNGQGDRDRVLALAKALPAEDVQFYYQMGLVGRRDLPLAPELRGGFEMVLLRMLAFRPAGTSDGPDQPLKTVGISQATVDSTQPVAASSPVGAVIGREESPADNQTNRVAPFAATDRSHSSTAADQPPVGAGSAREESPADNQTNHAAPFAATDRSHGSTAAEQPPADQKTDHPHSPPPAEQSPVGAGSAREEAAAQPQTAPEPIIDLPWNDPVAPAVVPTQEPILDIVGEQPALTPMPAPTPASAVPDAPETEPEPSEDDAEPVDYTPAGMDRDDEPPLDEDYYAPETDGAAYSYLDELASETVHDAPVEAEPEVLPAAQPATGLALQWLELFPKLPISGMTGSIAANCTLIAMEGDDWLLHLDPAQSALFNSTQQRRLNDALNQYHGRTISLTIELIRPEQETPAQAAARWRANRQADAEQSIHQDPYIQQMLQQFGAIIRDDTIEPVEAVASPTR
jgi:DNA polymerase-3 subunit gamma/tau